MFKYIVTIFVTMIGFLCTFAILMFPFMDSHPLGGWMSILLLFLILSIQISLIAVYFNNKKK